jgi:hypothetical protein
VRETHARPCPVCLYPARVTDWRPVAQWLAIEGCPCGGFFLWKPLADRRLPDPRDEARHGLAGQIQTVRAAGTEAWVGTRDGLVSGLIVVPAQRPE